MGRKVKMLEDVCRMEQPLEDEPHGWIQWKGTNVCMDVYCECGEQWHVDEEFCYSVKCPACGRSYGCSGYIELVELEQEPRDTRPRVIEWSVPGFEGGSK